MFLHMYAGLAPGITFAEASKRLDQISRDAAVSHRGDYAVDITGWKYFIVPLSSDGSESLQSWTWVFFASVMLLFAIVCLNTGSLLLLRSTERAFETSVRLALGAGCPSDGTAAARRGSRYLLFWRSCRFAHYARGHAIFEPRRTIRRPHFAAPVFAFGAVMTLLTAVVCAIYPIWAVARGNPSEALNTGGHQRTGSRGKQYWRRALVTVPVAASTVLLAMGGLLLHSYAQLLQTPLGFEAERVMTMQISLPALRYPSESSRRIFYDTVRNEIRRVPGVTDASACTLLPFGYGESVQPFRIAGQPGSAAPQFADVNSVLPGFFHTLRIPLLAGRYLDERDRQGSEPAILIDRNLARQYFAGKNPLDSKSSFRRDTAFR